MALAFTKFKSKFSGGSLGVKIDILVSRCNFNKTLQLESAFGDPEQYKESY